MALSEPALIDANVNTLKEVRVENDSKEVNIYQIVHIRDEGFSCPLRSSDRLLSDYPRAIGVAWHNVLVDWYGAGAPLCTIPTIFARPNLRQIRAPRHLHYNTSKTKTYNHHGRTDKVAHQEQLASPASTIPLRRTSNPQRLAKLPSAPAFPERFARQAHSCAPALSSQRYSA